MVFSCLVFEPVFTAKYGDLFKPMFKPKLVDEHHPRQPSCTPLKPYLTALHPLMLRLTKNRRIEVHQPAHFPRCYNFGTLHKSRNPSRNCPDKERIKHPYRNRRRKSCRSQILDFKTSDKEYTLNTLLEKASRKVVRQTVGEYLNGYIDRLLVAKQGRQRQRPFRNSAPR